MDQPKTKSTSYRLTETAIDLIEKIGRVHGLSRAAVIEMLARKEARELGIPYMESGDQEVS